MTDRIKLVSRAVCDVTEEVYRAEGLFAPLNSAHEAYAVILEELEEFKAEVFKKRQDRDTVNMRKELIQCAAMCVRAIADLDLDSEAGGRK